MKIRLAQIKVCPIKRNLRTNAELLDQLLHEIEQSNVDVVITPEGFLDGYCATEETVTPRNIRDYAIDPDNSPEIANLRNWCRRTSTWCILGCTRWNNDSAYNSALVINRQGELTGVYDKTHLQTHDYKYRPGACPPVFEGDFGAFGVMICADRRWPETSISLALKGARIIFNPTYDFHNDLNLAMMRARAFESDTFITFTHPAQSLVTGPCGQVVLNEERENVRHAISEVNLAEVDEARARPQAQLRDRRNDLYL